SIRNGLRIKPIPVHPSWPTPTPSRFLSVSFEICLHPQDCGYGIGLFFTGRVGVGGHINMLKASLMAFALVTGSTSAMADPAERYVNAKGFQAIKAEALEGKPYYSAARFPNKGASVFHPDANLAAPVRALLLMDSHEGALPHARYLISYQPTSEASAPDDTRDYVDITRFNLGPAVRADLMHSVSPEHLADVKVFGVGPHVRWRFALSPQRGMTAGLDAVGRRQVSAKEAAGMD